jgi:hypothetical protein
VGTDKPIEKICIRQDLNLQATDPKRREIPASSLLDTELLQYFLQ